MVASTTFIQTEFAKSSVDLQSRDGASQPVEDRTSLVETYRNAERALAAKQWRQAASLLASLIDPHNEHRLSHLCALRLADCHIKLNETNRAIQLLAKYLPQYRQSNRGDANSDREFQRGYVVLKELCQQLPNDHQSLAQLESLLESQPHSAWPDQAVELLFEKWRRQRNLKLWSDAIETGQLLRSETYAVFLTERQALS